MRRPQLDEITVSRLLAEWETALVLGNTDKEGAINAMLAVWEQIPAPKLKWDMFGQLVSRDLVELYRDTGQHAKAKEWLAIVNDAYNGDPHGRTMPFLSATVYFAAGEWDDAYAKFDEAHRNGKYRAFKEEDPKYWEFFKAERDKRAKK